MTPEEFATSLAKAIKAEITPAQEPTPAPAGVSLEDVQKLLVSSFAEFSKSIDEKIEKATKFSREGVGSKNQMSSDEDPREANPLEYLVKKAKMDINSFDDLDKALTGVLTGALLAEGLKYE